METQGTGDLSFRRADAEVRQRPQYASVASPRHGAETALVTVGADLPCLCVWLLECTALIPRVLWTQPPAHTLSSGFCMPLSTMMSCW
jgi:hypothetical protein